MESSRPLHNPENRNSSDYKPEPLSAKPWDTIEKTSDSERETEDTKSEIIIMNEATEIHTAHIFLWKWTRIILAIAFVGTALLIWWGSQPETEEWASYATRAAGPSIEITP